MCFGVADVRRTLRVTRHTPSNPMLRPFDVDWIGPRLSDADLDEFAEHPLQIIESFVVDPGRPPRGEELRRYLGQWVGSAATPQPQAAAATPQPQAAAIKRPSVATTSVVRT